jgi:hypothetical protein
MPMPRHNQPAVVLADVKATPSVAAARPALTSSARVGVGEMRSERKKAAGGEHRRPLRHGAIGEGARRRVGVEPPSEGSYIVTRVTVNSVA